ncbi:hypothetical protein GOODEAATRI_004811, partial [Goodea atripinnis]
LFRRSSVRSVGSFMNRVLRTLSTLSHFGTDEQAADDEKDEAALIPSTTGGSVPSDDSDCGGFPFGDKVPGVAGLKNHGNTCFMNAILQCLSNTELFAEYLALEQFRGGEASSGDSEKPKPNGGLVQKKGGSQQQQEAGEVTEQLSGLVRALWTFEYTPQHSRDFKNVVSKSALQFRGSSQHDAQEFLLWLLDRVHEDLNQIVHPDSRPPRKQIRHRARLKLDEALGTSLEPWFKNKRASVFCRPLYVTVVYQGKCSHCMRVGVAVPLSGTVSRLRQAVAQETKIPAQQNSLKYGTDNNRISTQIQEPTTPPQSPNKNSGQAEKIVLLVCNRACAGQQGRRFGNPFILYLERTVTWDTLQTEILEKMRHLLRPGAIVQVGPFTLRVVGVVGITYLLPQEEQPLCHPSVERCHASCLTDLCGPSVTCLLCHAHSLFKRTEDEYIPDAESVRQVKEQHLQPQTCTLAQCLQLYTKEEQDGDRRVKMQNMVKFPLTGMDMAPHMVKRSQSSWSLPSHWSPWRRPYGMGRDPEDYLYDLYAVCNHHGTMQGGHYTGGHDKITMMV